MLNGNANIEQLSASSATIPEYQKETIEFQDVTCFQITMEMRKGAREAVLPSSLHPTIPPCISLQIWEVGDCLWGPFTMALCRITCRSGVRARGFTSAVYASNEHVSQQLASNFGFPAAVADIHFRHSYDGTDIRVSKSGQEILCVSSLDPEPMGLSDVQYTGNLNLAYTPNGLRLVQLEAHHVASRVERLTSRLISFDGQAWGNELLQPYHVVSSSIASETISIPPVRFVCKPEELAFTGTESVAGEQ
ncbi:MAG: acetoacetate decarboxylase family protein [Pseudomonadales bacterium]|jgi:hypothetical protein